MEFWEFCVLVRYNFFYKYYLIYRLSDFVLFSVVASVIGFVFRVEIWIEHTLWFNYFLFPLNNKSHTALYTQFVNIPLNPLSKDPQLPFGSAQFHFLCRNFVDFIRYFFVSLWFSLLFESFLTHGTISYHRTRVLLMPECRLILKKSYVPQNKVSVRSRWKSSCEWINESTILTYSLPCSTAPSFMVVALCGRVLEKGELSILKREELQNNVIRLVSNTIPVPSF